MMIQDGLGLIWKRILTLKYLLVLTIAFNVIAATSGVVCSIYMWKGTFKLSDLIVNYTQKQNQLNAASKTVAELKNSRFQNKLSREEAFKEIQIWERLRLDVASMALDAAKVYPENYFTDPNGSRKWLETVDAEIQMVVKKHESEILSLAKRERALKNAVLWITALTLAFGIALPLIFLSLILKALRHAQKALTETAKDIVHDWSKALNRYGEDPFKNAHFWIEALLIITEQVGSQSRHPAAMLSAELSYLVRTELHKAQKTAA